ncbi:hypothetical protein [Kribbella sp. CA-294648]|uniref:hypothetical protein n=1 Tax=Kribbella sp. CA-294648 TaxID=3239948 RepID=UPI003D900C0D
MAQTATASGRIRSRALSTQEALTEDELADYIRRCPPEHWWAFGSYLRAERDLAGDPIGEGVDAGG